MTPKISVITVCFNAIQTIEKTILSTLNQDYPNVEYIIIDGNSNDGTVDVIKKYSKEISYWISEKDHGIYDAMNKGIKVATGDWITFRNSGDYFLSSHSLSDFFRQEVDRDVSVLHGNCYLVNEWGYIKKEPDILKFSYDIGVMPVIHPATFIKTSVHKQHLFNLSYRSSADYDLILRLLKEGYKFEYRPITIVVFDSVGFSTINWNISYFENCRIIGLYNKNNGRLKVLLGFIKLKIKYSINNLIDLIPVFRAVNKKIMIKKGWKALPVRDELS